MRTYAGRRPAGLAGWHARVGYIHVYVHYIFIRVLQFVLPQFVTDTSCGRTLARLRARAYCVCMRCGDAAKANPAHWRPIVRRSAVCPVFLFLCCVGVLVARAVWKVWVRLTLVGEIAVRCDRPDEMDVGLEVILYDIVHT